MLNSLTYQEELNRIIKSFPLDFLDGANVLITGASGLIGGVLADTIIHSIYQKRSNVNLWLMSRDEKVLQDRFHDSMNLKNIHLIAADVCKEINISEPIDYIVHAAGKGDPKSFATDPVGVMNANYLGMYQVLELAKRKKAKKVVYISSGEVYGVVELKSFELGMKEKDYGYLDILSPRACYASSKRAAETLCISYADQYGIDVSIARPCHTYGPATVMTDSRVIAEFMRYGLQKSDIIMKSPGLQKRSYCYVPDTGLALLYIMAKGVRGKAYNIANSKSVITIRELAELIAAKANVAIQYEEADQKEKKGFSDIMHAVLNSGALEELGWRPNYDIYEGIDRTLSILKDMYEVKL